MILTHITLKDFRSYESLDLDFGEGLTAIVGGNAAGKTNLAEAIQFISLARSWRTGEDAVLIRQGTESARIEARIKEGSLSRSIEIELGKAAKKISVNGKPVRKLSELSKLTNVIVFSPSDVALFVASPGERRSFLDVSLAKRSADYFSLISRYNRLLKERNALLKSDRPNLQLLDVLTEQLIDVAEPLVRYRSLYIASLNEALPKMLSRLKGENADCSLVYRPFVKADGSFRERAKKAYSEAREGDLAHRSTGIGPHREDFSFRLNGKDIADYGSQGENRMAVLALKLCPYLLVEEEEKKPVCVLDDVVSELDSTHQGLLFEVLKEFKQVFVTATELNIAGASYVDVSERKAIRRN